VLPPDYRMQRIIAEPEVARRERRLELVRARVAGRIVVEAEEGWDAARQAWNLAAAQRPPVVAFPESTNDVVELLAFARGHGLRVAPQGTGHGAAPLGAIEDALLLKPSRMREIEIDAGRRRARVGAGVTWGEVQRAAAVQWEWWATRWAAGWGGWPGSTAWPATACSPRTS
jgi:FAD/FMN-containing dehydrogenase